MNPLRSEDDAFKVTIVIAILAAPVVLAALLFGGGVALGVAGGLAFAGAFALVRNRRAPEDREADVRSPAADDLHRILVVANETLSGHALRDEVVYRAKEAGTCEIRVVCPALNTKLRHWTSDEDAARQEAEQRLAAVIASLGGSGLDVQGDIGSDDPQQAIEDALRTFRADEVILSTHPRGQSNWLEAGVVTRARARLPIPITHVVVDLASEQSSP